MEPSIRDYRLLKSLGSGSIGRVYLGQHEVTKEYHAVKIMNKKTIHQKKQEEHVSNEFSIISSLSHPFIVNFHQSFCDDACVYLVTEYVPGGELFCHLRQASKFPKKTAQFYAAEILLALEYMHSQDIIYRDLKPENITLDEHGHVKLVDFGFAKHVVHRTYTFCGTPDYVAPEIIQHKGHGKSADWWTFGVLIYEMLVGYPPFYSKDPLTSYDKITKGEFFFPSFLDLDSISIIKGLLTVDLSRRLGNLFNGSKDIKEHPWFMGIDWDALINKRMKTPYLEKFDFDAMIEE